MKTVEEVIIAIRNRPAMYIGRKSIFCLRAFLSGLLWRNPEIFNHKLMNEFQSWVQKKYNVKSSHSWADIIHFYSSDEQDALDTFFICFDEFNKKKLIDKETTS